MSHKTQTAELIRTTRLVAESDLQCAATIQGLTTSCIALRIRRLEKELGFRIFAPYDYGRVTWQGRKYLRSVKNELH